MLPTLCGPWSSKSALFGALVSSEKSARQVEFQFRCRVFGPGRRKYRVPSGTKARTHAATRYRRTVGVWAGPVSGLSCLRHRDGWLSSYAWTALRRHRRATATTTGIARIDHASRQRIGGTITSHHALDGNGHDHPKYRHRRGACKCTRSVARLVGLWTRAGRVAESPSHPIKIRESRAI